MAVLSDELNVTINFKWLIQIVVLVSSLTAGYFALKHSIETNTKDIEEIYKRVEAIEKANPHH